MFGLKNNSSDQKNTAANQPVNLNQKNNFNLDGLPIHTMAEDLAQIKNPANPKNALLTQKKSLTSEENLTEKQKSSPFLSPSNSWDNRSVLSEEVGNTTPKKPTSAVPAKDKIDWRIVILFIISLVLILALAFAGYSFWKRKTAPVVDITPPAEEQPTVPAQSYSQDSPNYLQLEDANADSEKIKTLLAQYVQTVAKEGYTKPVEFIVTDEKNAPLKFGDFATKLGLKLSSPVMNSLGDNFSLFIYNDNVVSRIGLVIDIKDNQVLPQALLQEETNLADEISPLFFTTNYSKDKLFYINEYKNVTIRYQNIISPENLTVDYAITQNKLLIGTTKLTMYALIDYLADKSP